MIGKLDNILVVSLQGIGDLLLTTPLLHGIKKAFPMAKLYILTFNANKDILSGNSDVDEIITFDYKNKSNILKVLTLLFDLRKRRFDLSVCPYPSGLRSAFIGYLSGARERFGQRLSLFKNYRWVFTNQTPITEVKHAVLMNLDFLRLLGIDFKDVDTRIVFNLNDEDKKFASEFLRDNNVEDKDLLIAVHAGGGRYTIAYRNWSAERFARVCDGLVERFKAKVILIGGKDDEMIVKRVISMMRQKPISAVKKASLKQTAVLIQRVKLLICNNSAPMHIAAALGTPTVSIFGSVDPRIHRPWGEGHIVLRKTLECSPCYYPTLRDTLKETKLKNRWFGRKFKCKTGDYSCLTSVSIEDVLNATKTILKIKKL